MQYHAATPAEKDLVAEITAAPVPYWVPDVEFGREWEMWRASHQAMGITGVTGFFTRRNLHALAALRHAIFATPEPRIREALMFAFTGCVNRASKRYQWNAKRPTNVMTGTLYISSLRYEWNVWSLFYRKALDVVRYYEKFGDDESASVQVLKRSAIDLSSLPDSFVSMVFMDPPFGSNIFYADSSLLWEAWLGTLTEKSAEIVVNKSRARIGGGKTLEDYGELMKESFLEAARVLKQDGYLVLTFSNTDDAVWLQIQRGIAAAGLKTVSVHILDKGQPSIKGVNGLKGKENVTCLDMVITLKNTKKSIKFSQKKGVENVRLVRSTIRTALRSVARMDEIYSLVVQALLRNCYSLEGITIPVITKECRKLGAIIVDGKWQLPQDAA